MSTGSSTAMTGKRWLLFARVTWVVIVLLTAAIFVASIPPHFVELHEVCAGEPCVAGQLSPGNTRALEELGVSVNLYAAYALALDFVVALGFCAVAALIFWKRSWDLGTLFVSFALAIFGMTWPDTFDTAWANPVWGGLAGFLSQLGLVSLFVFFFIFPDGRFVPRWTRFVVPFIFVLPILYVLFPGSRFIEPPMPVNISIFVGLWMSCLLAQVYRFRRVSGAVQRQQTKWLVFGVVALVLLLAAFLMPVVFFPALTQPGKLSLVLDVTGLTVGGTFGFLLIPLSIGAAILRYRLYDIDIIINRTLVYGSLTAALAVVYVGCVVGLQSVFRALTDQSSNLAIVASTLLIAMLFNPLRRRIQSLIDRRFYRRKYDAARILEMFSIRLRDETDLDSLNAEMVSVVRETMQPEYVSLWLVPSAGATPHEESRT